MRIEDNTEIIIEDSDNIFYNDFFIVEYEVYDYKIEFRIFEKDGIEYDTTSMIDLSLDVGDLFIEGEVRWDGCSNWNFHTEECMHHQCERTGLICIGETLADCFDVAKKKCPDWIDR